jgi:hypothetical protein
MATTYFHHADQVSGDVNTGHMRTIGAASSQRVVNA